MDSTTYTLTRDGEEIEVEVEYSVAPICAAVMPSMNDPGAPAEGGEIEDLIVTRDGAPFPLTAGEGADLEMHIYETHDRSDRGGDEYGDHDEVAW